MLRSAATRCHRSALLLSIDSYLPYICVQDIPARTLTGNAYPADAFQFSRQRENEANHRSNCHINHCACPLLPGCDDVHHDREREYVRRHNKDQKEGAGDTEEAATEYGKPRVIKDREERLACVGHVHYRGVTKFVLAYHVTTVGRKETEEGYCQDAAANFQSTCSIIKRDGIGSYGKNPSFATALGKDRIPREMVSAIITAHFVSILSGAYQKV